MLFDFIVRHPTIRQGYALAEPFDKEDVERTSHVWDFVECELEHIDRLSPQERQEYWAQEGGQEAKGRFESSNSDEFIPDERTQDAARDVYWGKSGTKVRGFYEQFMQHYPAGEDGIEVG